MTFMRAASPLDGTERAASIKRAASVPHVTVEAGATDGSGI